GGTGSAALAAPRWGRSRHRGRRRRCSSRITGGSTLIVLPVVDISVHYAVIVTVGPDRAGNAADGRTDHRALENAKARQHRAGRGTAGGANGGALGDFRVRGTRTEHGRARKR